jgi:hypothetical protein
MLAADSHLLDTTVDKESRVARLHGLDYPFLALFVPDVVAPCREAHAHGVGSEVGDAEPHRGAHERGSERHYKLD